MKPVPKLNPRWRWQSVSLILPWHILQMSAFCHRLIQNGVFWIMKPVPKLNPRWRWLSLSLTYCGISDKGLPVGHQLIQGGLLVILAADDGNCGLLGTFHLSKILINTTWRESPKLKVSQIILTKVLHFSRLASHKRRSFLELRLPTTIGASLWGFFSTAQKIQACLWIFKISTANQKSMTFV
jgi:hypothetical protein